MRPRTLTCVWPLPLTTKSARSCPVTPSPVQALTPFTGTVNSSVVSLARAAPWRKARSAVVSTPAAVRPRNVMVLIGRLVAFQENGGGKRNEDHRFCSPPGRRARPAPPSPPSVPANLLVTYRCPYRQPKGTHARRPPTRLPRRGASRHPRDARPQSAERGTAARLGTLPQAARNLARRLRRKPRLALPGAAGNAPPRVDPGRVEIEREQSARPVLQYYRRRAPAPPGRSRRMAAHLCGRQPRTPLRLPGRRASPGFTRTVHSFASC